MCDMEEFSQQIIADGSCLYVAVTVDGKWSPKKSLVRKEPISYELVSQTLDKKIAHLTSCDIEGLMVHDVLQPGKSYRCAVTTGTIKPSNGVITNVAHAESFDTASHLLPDLSACLYLSAGDFLSEENGQVVPAWLKKPLPRRISSFKMAPVDLSLPLDGNVFYTSMEPLNVENLMKQTSRDNFDHILLLGCSGHQETILPL